MSIIKALFIFFVLFFFSFFYLNSFPISLTLSWIQVRTLALSLSLFIKSFRFKCLKHKRRNDIYIQINSDVMTLTQPNLCLLQLLYLSVAPLEYVMFVARAGLRLIVSTIYQTKSCLIFEYNSCERIKMMKNIQESYLKFDEQNNIYRISYIFLIIFYLFAANCLICTAAPVLYLTGCPP